ncbi:MAG: tyrosine--tRNA ligase [Nitrososphaerota archaeon]|jgi:tyrosyl-tRNA synthetase|nr:tyrosine--tRNA ligase [Candidatus Termiticorpusculum sp.]MDR0460437.1 tyrosine--tRNA ligase [Nitrososphaerota archaeon]
MDIERRIELICRAPTEEVVTVDDLRCLLEVEEHPVAYGGWEPSGLAHLGTGVICAYKMKDFAEAGIRFKVFLATWHAYLNNKLNGDLSLIRKAADLFRHSWIALGVPADKVEFIYSDELYDNLDYWAKILKISKELTVARTIRTLEIAGRKEGEAHYVSDYLYTPLQVADIFEMDVKICQLGLDQRKANMVAREIGEKIGYWKPVCVHHHLLQGLAKPGVWPIPEGQEKEAIASAKMSKSQPDTCVFIYDQPEEIKQKMSKAFCPERIVKHNPVLDICKYIIFREKQVFTIERPAKFGGNIDFQSYLELESAYVAGNLHPMDLKTGVATELGRILEPVRRYFENNSEAKSCLETVRAAKVTR